MDSTNPRYQGTHEPVVADGWSLQRLTPPSRLFGANGLRTGPDGRIYVAQVSGSQVSAVDVNSGLIETISPKGGDIVAPDDLVFDPEGNFYATEITEGRVSMQAPNGKTRVIYGDMPCANPITWHQGRLYAGECRVGGRIMELDLNGGPPRILLDNVMMPNAMEVGPDGKLYFPVMGTNEIWRIGLDGGEPEVVARDLGVPDAVKFDSKGQIVSTQVASGQVLRVNPLDGSQTVLANLAPGLDNLTFVGERLFVSNINGQIDEILEPGVTRQLVPEGFNCPLGIAMINDNELFIADGPFAYTLRPGDKQQLAGMLFTPGYPGYSRGAASLAPGQVIVATANGDVARFNPSGQESEVIASGFDQLYGVVATPGGGVITVEQGAGRVLGISQNGDVETLASGLNMPVGVALASDGSCYVSESGAGRVVKLVGGKAETFVDGLRKPHGIVFQDGLLYIVDAESKELIEYESATGKRKTVATDLPVGAPPGVVPKFLKAIGTMSGPMGPFSGITAGADGTLYLSADAEGSVMALRRQ